MRYFKHAPKVWDKGGDAGPVTEADLAIDAELKSRFLDARPDYGWLSEETDDDPARFAHSSIFIVDPIDGTRSFINGQVNFAISVAIARDGVLQAGVVHLPAKDMTFSAQRGAGAFCNGAPIRHNGQSQVEGARILTSGATLSSDLWTDQAPPFERHFRSSLAYRLCLVANGRFDGMITLRPTWEWDVAAGELICQEAGVAVSCIDGTTPHYNSPKGQLHGMIAAPAALQKGLLSYL